MNQTPISLAISMLNRTEKEEKLPRAERPDRGLEGLHSASGSAKGASMGGGSLPDSPRADFIPAQESPALRTMSRVVAGVILKHGIAYNANRREADDERNKNRGKQSAGIRRSNSIGRYIDFCGVVAGRSRSGESGSWILLIGLC